MAMVASGRLVLGVHALGRQVQSPSLLAFRALSGGLQSPCPQAAASQYAFLTRGVALTQQRRLEEKVLQPQLLWPSLQGHRGIKPAVRDPERPKRPQTAWLRFLQHFRATNPDMTGVLVMRSAATKWKSMNDTEKAPWESEYRKAKAEFEVEYKKYVESGKKEAWEKPPGKPKKPQSAFFLFLNKCRVETPQLKATELAKSGGDIWKTMTAAQKAPFEQEAERAKAQYEADLKAYKESGAEDAWKEKTGLKAQEDKKKAAAEKKAAEKEKKKAAAAKKKEAAAKKKLADAEKKKKAAAKKKEAAEKQKAAEKAKKAKSAEKTKKAKSAEKTKKAKKAAKTPKAAAAKTPKAPVKAKRLM